MYLLPIHVPIHVDGSRLLLASDWLRSLRLLRDSLPASFGRLVVIAPTLPPDHPSAAQRLEPVDPDHEGIGLVPSFDLRTSAKAYWLRDRRRWIHDLEATLPGALVVHGGYDDVYRPIAYEGLVQAWKRGVTSVFVQDTDIPLQMRQLAAKGSVQEKIHARVYGALYDRACLRSVARCDLSLLKGAHLMERYGREAKNPKEFHDTSFSRADMVTPASLERRLESLRDDRPLRFVYCGRLEARKGIDRSIAIVRRAAESGARVEFDVIGDGAERESLTKLAGEGSAPGRVRLLGSRPYGPELLRDLAAYDALLFTPTAEDTPRMIFDGYAAGLPLVACDIDYVKERAREDRAAIVMPQGDVEASARRIVDLDARRDQVIEVARAARAAAEHHSAESWYERRAAGTLEAHERRLASRR